MTRKTVGLLMLTLAAALLSVQFYFLPILQYLSFALTGQAYADIASMIFSFPLNLSFLLSTGLFIAGFVLALGKKN